MKNRIVMTPMDTNYGEQTGEMSFLHMNYYEQRAKGGTGLIIVENASVFSPQGSNGTTQLRFDHDSFIPRLYKLCETVHKHGACIAILLNHAGASAQALRTGMQPVSASDIPSKAGGEIPRPLTNKRTDEFGGSPENRARFAKMVLEEVRKQVGEFYPIFVRISANEFLEGGNTLEYLQYFEKEIDVFDVSAGL